MSVRVSDTSATDPALPRADIGTAGAAVGLVLLAAAASAALSLAGRPVHATSAPITGVWLPHVGPGSIPAAAVAVLVVWRGPGFAAAAGWSRLLAAGYAAAVAWILSLAMVDGWQRGVVGRLGTEHEYLSEVAGVTDVPAMLRGFAARILDFQPDSWNTHVAGHPPGALLVFVALDRMGLGGGAWAGIACILIGALLVVAVPATIRVLGDEGAARAAVPFLVLFPGAVWIGVSADGLFTGVAACGVALFAVAVTRRGAPAAQATGVTSGVLLAFGIYLSYGLTLIAVPVLAVLILARRIRALPAGAVVMTAAGAAAVVTAFSVTGFWWPDGYHLVVERYYQGIASRRPYAYWVWADLAAMVVCAGPVTAVILRRAVATLRHPGRPARHDPAVLLPLAGLIAILAADLSGLSKAEVERIWLPFAGWLAAGVALLPPPSRRWWLAAQAVTALAVNHLLLTSW